MTWKNARFVEEEIILNGFESYKLTEWKRQTIQAAAVTSGIIRMLVFGGWVSHDDGVSICLVTWAFDYKSNYPL